MILIIQVMTMKDENFKVLVLVVVAFLVVSLAINAFLASDPHSFSSPPARVNGYFTEQGEPLPGYYFVPDQFPRTIPDRGDR
jgi:hypothetical protein